MNFSARLAIRMLLVALFTASGLIALSLVYPNFTNKESISSQETVTSVVLSGIDGSANTSPTPTSNTSSIAQPKQKVPCIALPVFNPAVGLIEWANIFRFNGIFYYSDYDVKNRPVGRLITNTDLGFKFAKVKCNLNERVRDVDEYQSTDGDASFLPTNTPVYTVKGYRPEFRLAAYLNNQLLLFESNQNPKAKKGADLLDIKDKVQYIGINSGGDPKRELAAIKNSKQVASLVDMVLKAPVDQNYREQKERRYLIVFHLKDGTTVTRSYWTDSNELTVGILLPKQFRTIVEQALRQ